MKRLLAIIIAVIAIMVMTAVPVLAAEVDTNVDVGANTTAPYMILSTMTPDDTPGDGVQVNPEFAKPDANGNFPSTDPTADGWKLVKFYVEVGHVNGLANIDNVAIDAFYPTPFNSVDDPLFHDRADKLKFEINARRDAQSATGWSAQIVYPYPETYPANDTSGVRPAATMPALGVRQLVYATPSDIVDVNCDDTLGNDNDMNWQSFLPFWTADRISYAPSYDAGLAFEKYQLGQALVLEIKGWMWFHQPGVRYGIIAKAATEGGATSPTLGSGNKFLHYNRVFGLYTDFTSVNYPSLTIGTASWAEGDRFLNTPTKTTVWNNGNVGAQVLVSSTKMVKIDYANPAGPITSANIHSNIYYNSAAKTIEHFDAMLYYSNGTGTVLQLGAIDYLADAAPAVIEVSAENPLEFGPTGAVLLQQCRPAKIEFSVHPELGESQESGQYKGFLTVSVATYTGGQLPTL